MPDGRFVIIQRDPADATRSATGEGLGAGPSGASNIILVQNWFEQLKRLVPAN